MHGTKAQVLDLGLCSIHTKFHSFILGTSGGNSGLFFILKMGPCISNIFPIWPKIGLGPLFYSGIQLNTVYEFEISSCAQDRLIVHTF